MKLRAKSLLVLLTGMLAGVGPNACGRTSRQASSAFQTGSNASVTDGASTVSTNAMLTSQHQYGEYDEDDSPTGTSHGDGDNDDAKPTDRDNDSDNSSSSYYDSDDTSVRGFGHAANASDRRAITALIASYYAAAAAGDGAKACSLIYSTLAGTLPEDLAGAGPAYLRGTKTCPRIMSKLFEQNHLQFAAYSTKLEVSGIRLKSGRGLVVLGFKTLPGRQIEVGREHGVWKIFAVVDQELP
jgi:hypothetical protein